MRLVVGYDQAWSVQCYKWNLRQLVCPGEMSLSGISEAEVNYFAERLAETSVFGYSDRIGNPWMHEADARELDGLSLV